MTAYYVNTAAQPTGEHEVHKQGCEWMPQSRTYLGEFESCGPAIAAARLRYRKVDGCATCAPECHTR